MNRVLVTGATGLVGSNTCEVLRHRGDGVVALIRHGSQARALLDLGVEIVEGDIANRDIVRRAAEGVDGVIHSAALLPTEGSPRALYESVNVAGTGNVLAAAAEVRARAVILNTLSFFDSTVTLTETSPLDRHPPTDPYTQTKREAYLATMESAARGEDALTVVLGRTFGPSPLPQRALQAPSFNLRLAQCLEGRMYSAFPAFKAPFGFARDVAECCVLALEHGSPGGRYLALGPPGSAMTTGSWLTQACELAGKPHRVRDIAAAELDDPEVQQRFPASLTELARRPAVDPFFEYSTTVTQLGYSPHSVRAALAATISWLSTLPSEWLALS
jgi:dihydroflavonol-4-reductase